MAAAKRRVPAGDNRRPGAHHRPRGQEGALPGRVLLMCNTTTPLGSGGSTPGRPTVRKVQLPSGRRMTQEAKADSRNGDRKPGTAWPAPPPDGFRITGRIRAVARPERELTWVR